MTSEDSGALAAMIAEFDEHLWLIYGERKSFSRTAKKRAVERAGLGSGSPVEGLIAEDRGKPCGYALYSLSFNTEVMKHTLSMSDLFVRRSWRRKGVGEALMKRLQAIAGEWKCGSIVWTVWDRNPAALAFYLKLGAKPVSDEFVMSWKVGARRKASGR